MYFLYVAVLVAFVVILFSISSRVRKSAKMAFASETVDAGGFTIVKPEGFINPVGEDSKFDFETFSRDFGKGEAENLRQAEAFVTALETENYAEAGARIKKSGAEILSEDPPVEISAMNKETLEKAVAYNFYKIIHDPKNQRIYQLKITVLEEFFDDYQDRVTEMLKSFRFK